jgi:TAG lipase / lysophosphatidylethanolamine acyltransferase
MPHSALASALDEGTRLIEDMEKKLDETVTYDDWLAIALELDRLTENDIWRSNPASNIYDYRLIQSRLQHLRQAREANDISAMIYLLRAGLLRNLGGINDPRLFSKTYIGYVSINPFMFVSFVPRTCYINRFKAT